LSTIGHYLMMALQSSASQEAIRPQELEVNDEAGNVYAFTGKALSVGAIPTWPNATFRDTVYRWQDANGRVCHSATQEMWFGDYQRLMKRRTADNRTALLTTT
jgi:hypothetical protein